MEIGTKSAKGIKALLSRDIPIQCDNQMGGGHPSENITTGVFDDDESEEPDEEIDEME
jgi:hypothetical protein